MLRKLKVIQKLLLLKDGNAVKLNGEKYIAKIRKGEFKLKSDSVELSIRIVISRILDDNMKVEFITPISIYSAGIEAKVSKYMTNPSQKLLNNIEQETTKVILKCIEES